MKRWNHWSPGDCSQNTRGYSQHSSWYSILSQHFPKAAPSYIRYLLRTHQQVGNQTCTCTVHGSKPLGGPLPWLREPVPDFGSLLKIYQEQLPNLTSRAEFKNLYRKKIMAWIYARLYLYLNPYMEKNILNDVKCKAHEVQETYGEVFSKYEADFLNDQLYLYWHENIYNFRQQKIAELADLKRTYCSCSNHSHQRLHKLINALKLDKNYKTRYMLLQYLKEMEDNFILYLPTCFQTDHKKDDVCQLLMLDVRSDNKGDFLIKHLVKKNQSHEDGNMKLYTNSTL